MTPLWRRSPALAAWDGTPVLWSALVAALLGAVVFCAGCLGFGVDPLDRPCTGGCLDGYECSALTERCVPVLDPSCPGSSCAADVADGQSCTAPGVRLPCPGYPEDCSVACRYCQPDGHWGSCPPPAEPGCIAGSQRRCYTGPLGSEGVGLCHGGNQECSAGLWGDCLEEIVPGPEVCNGEDDDCDEDVDEPLELTAPAGTCPALGVCLAGAPDCIAGEWTCDAPGYEATEVSCDEADNDCDGATDTALPPPAPRACPSFGECTTGLDVCTSGAWTCAGAAIELPDEVSCDGLDNDCDGVADDGACAACEDGLDNDGDRAIDLDDPGCAAGTDGDEDNPLPAETCAAKTPLVPPAATLATGTLVGAGNAYGTTCGVESFSREEVVYRVVVPAGAEGLVVATDYPGTTFESLASVRDVCDDLGSELACDNAGGVGARSYLRTGPLAPGTYFAFIDGVLDEGAYDYEALIQVLLPSGFVCDATSRDHRCAPNLECTGGVCAPATCDYRGRQTGPFTATGSTAALEVVHGGDGPDCDTSRAPAAVYELTLASAALLSVSLDDPMTDYDTILYIRDGCGGEQVACNDDDVVPTGPSALHGLALTQGVYAIYVSGWGRGAGSYKLTVTQD